MIDKSFKWRDGSEDKLKKIFQNKFGGEKINYTDPVDDDPKVRKPDISKAKQILDWEPKTDIVDGLDKTFNYFKSLL